MASYKNPPEMREDLLYEDWKKELTIWCGFTDLDKKKQGPALFLTLKGKARESVLAEIKPELLQSDNGVKVITEALDKLYAQNKSESAFAAFDNFIKFKRPNNMQIKDYVIEFNLRLSKINSHDMKLPDGVLAYYLLECANLTTEQTSLCRATCQNLTYADMKAQIERVSVASTPAEQLKVEPQFVAHEPHVVSHEPHFGAQYQQVGLIAEWCRETHVSAK